MARSVSLTTLRTRVYRRGDWENATDRVTQSEVDDAINEAIADTWDKIVRANGKHKRKTSTGSTTSGTATIPLASDCYLVSSVQLTNSGVNQMLTNYEETEDADYSAVNSGTGFPIFYMLAGDYLKLMPTPDGAYSYTVTYVPCASTLSVGSDTFDGINGFEEHAVFGAVKRIAFKNKEWELIAACEQGMAREEARIEQMVSRRDALPHKIVDVYGIERTNRRGRWSTR